VAASTASRLRQLPDTQRPSFAEPYSSPTDWMENRRSGTGLCVSGQRVNTHSHVTTTPPRTFEHPPQHCKNNPTCKFEVITILLKLLLKPDSDS
jgi:hypothetical protein